MVFSVLSALEKIITTGYQALNLQRFFTCGHDEVRAWTIMVRTYIERGGREGEGGGWTGEGERREMGKGEKERGGTGVR